jgi:hypothetical protein
MDAPLSTYEEATLNRRRTFELHKDRVVIKGKYFANRFEGVVMLKSIRPEPDRFWLTNRMLVWGILIASCAGVPLFISYMLYNEGDQHDIARRWMLAGTAIAVVGVLMCLGGAAKIEMARFLSPAGIAVLDVIRAGPDRHRFDEFVEQIVNHARANQAGDD